MSVVIIGSNGQLGQDLIKIFGDQAVGLNHQEFDITDGVGVVTRLRELQADWVLNTAAFHRVDDCELNPGLTFAVNTLGAANVARAAAAIGAGVVFFSTDYVFGGDVRGRDHPHSEVDGPQPLNVYGVSKWAGERLVMQSNPRHLVVRSAGLYGTATSRKGWTFPELMLNKARDGEHLRVVDDQALSPTYTADLAEKVKELIDRDAHGLFHLANAGECSWYEFAQATLDMAGIDARIDPIATTRDQRRAQRPAYSALTSVRLSDNGITPLRAWRDALRSYLQAKGAI